MIAVGRERTKLPGKLRVFAHRRSARPPMPARRAGRTLRAMSATAPSHRHERLPLAFPPLLLELVVLLFVLGELGGHE